MAKRTLHIGERVFNCNPNEDDLRCFGTIVAINGKEEDYTIEDDDDEFNTMVLLELEDHFGEYYKEPAENIYQIDKLKTDKCGFVVCFEHITDIDYPYYVPERDENFYEFEL